VLKDALEHIIPVIIMKNRIGEMGIIFQQSPTLQLGYRHCILDFLNFIVLIQLSLNDEQSSVAYVGIDCNKKKMFMTYY
jgi:hypothetical protein